MVRVAVGAVAAQCGRTRRWRPRGTGCDDRGDDGDGERDQTASILKVVAPRSAGADQGEDHYGLAILRIRGIERVRLPADLVVLGRLSLAPSTARAIAA